MARFTLAIDGHAPLAGNFNPVGPGTLPRDMTFVRVLHELELASHLSHTTPPDRPEVRQLFPENLFVPFGRAWQRKAWDMNPRLKAHHMTAVYHYQLWIANNNGFGDRKKLRANYFTEKDLSSPLPKVETLTCGGNVHRVIGETIIKRGGKPVDCHVLETLDYRKTPPDVIPPWLTVWAVNMGTDGTPRRFQQGRDPVTGFVPGVAHPFLSDPKQVIAIPKWRCVRWTDPEPPDPYRIYL